jgi:hypothetical protein
MYSIPSDRVYTWAGNCGVPGGIPIRTTIYTTLNPGATASQINAAITACPSGQVVKLNAGTYNVSGIHRKTGTTVRGAGAGQTIINSGSSTAFSSMGSDFDFATSSGSAIANGAWLQKGSYSVTLTSSPGSSFAVGRLILINQDDDHVLVFPRTGNWAGTRNLRHISRITGVSGNTVTFETPIPYSFSYAQSPKAQAISAGLSLSGVEDMTINAGCAINFTGADRCWIYRCETSGFGNESIFLRSCYGTEIRRCYIHDASGFPTISDGFGIYAQYAVGETLAEDNIAYHLSHMFIMNGDSTGAYIYNYAWGLHWDSRDWVWPAFNCNHGPHPIMSLWEGNIGERWQNDTYHGTASHQTLFRNHIHGVNPYSTIDRRTVDFCRASYYFNAVGNIIGADSATSPSGVGWTPDYYQASKVTGTGYFTGTVDRNDSFIWVLGYPNSESGSLSEETTLTGFTPPGGTYPDSNVIATLIRHGNYDYYHKSVFDWSDPDHTLPNSLYYSSKPTYFGNLDWPAIGPDVSGLVKTIPAKYRWDAYVASGYSNLSLLFADQQAGEPTYTLGIVPSTRTVSIGAPAAYDVTVNAESGFTDDVTLGVLGLPAGVTPVFGDNPLGPDETTTLVIPTDDIEVGTLNLTLTGE